MRYNLDKYQEIKGGPNYIKDPNQKLIQRSQLKLKANQHIIDKIPIGQRYQKENKIPINQYIKGLDIKFPKEIPKERDVNQRMI